MGSQSFDLVVLGSGPAAARVATRCAKAKWRVAVIDPNPVGGTCALHGCNPKKVLVRAAELVDRAHMMQGNGTHLGEAEIDWPDLIRFKRQFTDPVSEGRKNSFEEMGIEIIQARPRFTGQNTLDVDGQTLQAKYVLIATGAMPMELPIDGAELLTTSDEFMQLEALPKRIVFVGGGYISLEFAHVAARAGSRVTIIEQEKPLAGFDQELVQHLIERSRKIGIEVHAQTSVESIQQTEGKSFQVAFAGKDGKQTIEADLVVHGAGRVPNVKGLELELAGIQCSKHGIEVNEYYQSVSNPAVYAAGDVVASDLPALTPVANYQGKIVAENLLEGNVRKNEHPVVPAAVFTVPSLAAIGLTEQQAKQQGKNFKLNQGDWAEFSSMKKVGETHALYKVLIDKQSDQILGAHLFGPEAAEVINLFALAMKMKLPARTLKSTPFVFPTFGADITSML